MIGAPVRYDVTVVTDTSERDALYKNLLGELKNAMPQTPIEFSGNAESIVLMDDLLFIESGLHFENGLLGRLKHRVESP